MANSSEVNEMNDAAVSKPLKKNGGNGYRYRGLVQKGRHRGMHRFEAYFHHPPGKKKSECFFLEKKLDREARAKAKQVEVDYIRANPGAPCGSEDKQKILFKDLRTRLTEIMTGDGCRPRTIRRAQNTFDHFCEFLRIYHHDIQRIAQFHAGIYGQYKRFVYQDLKRKDGWYSECGTLKAAMNRLYRDRYCEYKQIEELMREKLSKPQPKHYISVDREEKRKLYEYVKGDRYNYSGVLYFIMRYGLRIGEVLSIKPGDVYFDKSRQKPLEIMLGRDTRKTKRYHIVPLVPDTQEIVNQFYDPTGQWLFMNSEGSAHTRSNHFYAYLVKVSQKVLNKRLTPHYFRHNASTTMTKAGVANKDGMGVTGHESEQVYTRCYTHSTSEGVVKALKATEF